MEFSYATKEFTFTRKYKIYLALHENKETKAKHKTFSAGLLLQMDLRTIL